MEREEINFPKLNLRVIAEEGGRTWVWQWERTVHPIACSRPFKLGGVLYGRCEEMVVQVESSLAAASRQEQLVLA